MTYPPMRPQIELQRVHDMLMALLSNHELTKSIIPPGLVVPLMMAADCLCWALHHDDVEHADRFARIVHSLRVIVEELKPGCSEAPGDYIVEE